MTVGELRAILENEYIPDDLIIHDYEDRVIIDVNLQIEKDGSVSTIKFSMDEA